MPITRIADLKKVISNPNDWFNQVSPPGEAEPYTAAAEYCGIQELGYVVGHPEAIAFAARYPVFKNPAGEEKYFRVYVGVREIEGEEVTDYLNEDHHNVGLSCPPFSQPPTAVFDEAMLRNALGLTGA
jgi:hypothetical protein